MIRTLRSSTPSWTLALSALALTLAIALPAFAGGEKCKHDGKTKTALQMVGILCLLLGYPYHLTLGPIDLGVVDLVYAGMALIYVSLFFSLLSAASYVRLFAS